MKDVIIIGAGVAGCACARELSRYQADILVLDKEEDVCCGTSKANSAIVHAGFDAKPGTLMAKLNVAGSRRMESLSKELDFPYQRCGSLVLCLSEAQKPDLQRLYERGVANGVEGLKILDREALFALEPYASREAVAALWAPTGAIVCPFGLNIALAENACENGAEFRFNEKVTHIRRIPGGWAVKTEKGTYETRTVVNAAGVYSGMLHNMVSENTMTILPRRGDYMLLDKKAHTVSHTIFNLPGKYGKGVLVSPTVHGNTIVGPTAVDVEDPESTATTAQGLEAVRQGAVRMVENLPLGQVITSFAGLRAHEPRHDFFIGELPEAPGFVDCAAIESPGLSACPAIGEMVAEIVKNILNLQENPNFCSRRMGIRNPREMDPETRAELVNQEPAYGQIICRCEGISEGEIVDSIRRPLGARSVDGVKRRVRAGMGRCQGGFCSPRVMEILARELNCPPEQITKAGPGSPMAVGKTKGV